MAPLVVLILTFAFSLLALRVRDDRWSVRPAGRLAIAVMFVFTGMSHFFMAERMIAMVPPAFPRPELWVVGTGIAEIFGGVALLIPGLSRVAAGCLIVLLLGVFPANVYPRWKRIRVICGFASRFSCCFYAGRFTSDGSREATGGVRPFDLGLISTYRERPRVHLRREGELHACPGPVHHSDRRDHRSSCRRSMELGTPQRHDADVGERIARKNRDADPP
ncbi:MAG: DoxX family membrane protein [Acidobacteriota bacterium]|nr:DoxX family membrane protein [Acidobacteriota bacterium]